MCYVMSFGLFKMRVMAFLAQNFREKIGKGLHRSCPKLIIDFITTNYFII